MAEHASAADGAGPPHGLRENAEKSSVVLSYLTGVQGPFTGKPFDPRLACTASESRTCQILDDLGVWNEFLYEIGLQLREAPPRTRGQFFVSGLEDVASCPHAMPNSRLPATLLHCLMTEHRCVCGLDVTDRIARDHEALLCNALRRSRSVKSLRLVLNGRGSYQELCVTIENLTYLEELEYPTVLRHFLKSLSTLLQRPSSLTCLRIGAYRISRMEADMLLRALQANASLKELSVFSSVITCAWPACREKFGEFLKNYCRLTAFTVVRCIEASECCLNLLLDALRSNRTLTRVRLQNFVMDQASAGVLRKVFLENSVLRSFDIGSLCVLPVPYSQRELFDCRAAAFRGQRTLEEVSLPFQIWGPDYWESFFQLLSAQQNVKKVVVHAECAQLPDLDKIYKRLLETKGSVEKVSFTPVQLYSYNVISQCEAPSEFNLVVDGYTDVVPLLETMLPLPPLLRITALVLRINASDWAAKVSSAVANSIEKTATLKKLYVLAFPEWQFPLESEGSFEPVWQALTRNTTIAVLHADISYLAPEEAQCIADAIKLSKNIRRGVFDLKEITSDFVSHLSRDFEDNYTVIDISLNSELCEEREEVTGNSGLVSRACEFLSAARCDRLCAGAVEVVSRHRPLLAELADVMSVSDTEVRSMVRDTVKSLENMHAFMRMVGVVRERVECQQREDGRVQLDDLNEDCGRAIRHFLNCQDVRETSLGI